MDFQDQENSEFLKQSIEKYESQDKFRYKSKDVSIEDYARQRALNEVFRYLLDKNTISFEQFGEILARFDLRIHVAPTRDNKTVSFVKHFVEFDIVTGESVASRFSKVVYLINPLHDNDSNL